MLPDHPTRRPLLGIFLACLLLAGCTSGTDSDEPRPRNVILISLDTVRQDRLTCFGHSEKTSPTIDRLAREGTMFSNASTTSPWTLPAHVSMLSGLYPHRHRVQEHEHAIPSDVETLAMFLSRLPMTTAGIVSSELLTKRHGLGRGFDTYKYVSEWGPDATGERRIRNPGRFVTDQALTWLRQRDEEPFFLFLHYYDAHSDYAPEEKYRAMFVDPYEGTADGSTDHLRAVSAGTASLTKKDAAHLKQLYDAEIRQVDDEVAKVLAFLDESGLSKSTLIILTSDHGEEFLEHGSVLHGRTYYEEMIQVPLVLRGPGVPVGKAIETIVTLADISPTILTVLGQPVPDHMQGIDLTQLWRHPEKPHRSAVLAEADKLNELPLMYRMVRSQRYKLILEWRTEGTQLYDLRDDPLELQDISKKHPELVKALHGELTSLMRPPGAAATRVQFSEEELQRLRGLGYMK